MKTIFLAALLSCIVHYGFCVSLPYDGLRLVREEKYIEAIPVLEKAAHDQPGSAEVLLNLGWSYWHAQRIEDAWKIGTTLVKLDGKNPTFLVFLANTEIERRNYQAALDLAGRALKLTPDDKDASLVSSRALFLLRREAEALAVLDGLLQRTPDYAQALYRKAVILGEMGQKEQALGYLDGLVKADPGNSAYRRQRAKILDDLGRWDEAKLEWRDLVRREPDADSLLNLGWAYWRDKNFEEAWKIGVTLVKLDEMNPTFLLFLANTQIERRDYQAAQELAGRALKLAPDDKDAYMVSARALFRLQREDEALAVLDAVIKRNPDYAQALYRKAVFLSEMGRKEAALEIMEKLAESDPKSTVYRRERAKIFYDLGRWEEAKAEWRDLAKQEPDADSLLNLGWALWRDKNIDEAWKVGSMLVKLDAGNPAALRFMANIEMERQNYPEAMRIARKALDLAPGDRDASLVLVKTLFQLMRPKEAAVILKRLIKDYPDHLGVQSQWADYLAKTGESAEALGRYDRLIAANPANDLYRLSRAQVLCDLGRFPDAVNEWRFLALRQEPNSVALRRLREDAMARRSWGEALEWQHRIIDARSADAADWEMVSKIQTSRKDPRGALDAAQKAIAIDPHSINGYYMRAEAFEQLADWPAAQKAYEDLTKRNPNSLRALNGLSNALESQQDFLGAIQVQHRQTRLALPSVSQQLVVREARLLADAGRPRQARRLLQRALRHRQTAIPVLLYHGVLRHERDDSPSITQDSLRRQLAALKHAGYQTITVTDLERDLRNPSSLPAKPLLVTFDDGRVDTFENADPILKELGFKATMFVHLSKLRKWSFHSTPEELRHWQSTGRWDMQAHGNEAHDPMLVDRDGHKGSFLANRMWLNQEYRLETLAEYRTRLDNEYKTAKQGLEDMVPGIHVVALAYPFGDFGMADNTNTPQSAAINQELVRHTFRLAFVQEQFGVNSLSSNPFDLKRFEVPRYMTPQQLVAHLAMSDPWVQGRMLEAQFWMRSEQPSRAHGILDGLKQEGIFGPALWAAEAAASANAGDVYRAQQLYAQADALESEGAGFSEGRNRSADSLEEETAGFSDDRYRRLLQQSQNGNGPNVAAEGQGFSDSQGNNGSKLLVRAGFPVRSARIEGWVGQGRYTDRGVPGESAGSITGREAGVQTRWFPIRDLLLDASYAHRFFSGDVSGAGPKNADNYAVGAAYQILPQINAALRDGMGNVETATAIQQGIRFHSDGGGLIWDPAMDWRATADYDVWRYNDSNMQNNLQLRLQRKVIEWLSLGAAYQHEDTKYYSAQYYTPQGLNQYTGSLTLSRHFGAPSERTGLLPLDAMFRYEAGYGSQPDNARMIQSVRGGFSWRFAEHFVMNVDAQYSMSPTYISRTINGSLGMRY
jgi:tetratricopeptide (TPR) repeat protein